MRFTQVSTVFTGFGAHMARTIGQMCELAREKSCYVGKDLPSAQKWGFCLLSFDCLVINFLFRGIFSNSALLDGFTCQKQSFGVVIDCVSFSRHIFPTLNKKYTQTRDFGLKTSIFRYEPIRCAHLFRVWDGRLQVRSIDFRVPEVKSIQVFSCILFHTTTL